MPETTPDENMLIDESKLHYKATLTKFFDRLRLGYVKFRRNPGDEYERDGDIIASDVNFYTEDGPRHLTNSNVVTSQLIDDGNVHYPIIDIDFPIYSVPSSRSGHHHLYIDRPLSWEKYRFLLWALHQCGFIERGYYEASIKREMTVVRLPWIKKPPPPPEVICNCEMCNRVKRHSRWGRPV